MVNSTDNFLSIRKSSRSKEGATMEEEEKKELEALIAYMVHHNEHHNEELKDLLLKAGSIDIEAANKIKEAIASFTKGNESLKGALETLKK